MTDAQALLVRAVRLSQTCGLLRLDCDNTGWRVEIEAAENYLSVVIVNWSDLDIVLFDSECADPESVILGLERAIDGHSIIIEKLRLVS